MTRSPPSWIVVVAIILVLQTVSATLGRLVPVAGPAFTLEFGWDQAWIGYFTAASVVGALFVLTSGIGPDASSGWPCAPCSSVFLSALRACCSIWCRRSRWL
jgi:hypothetical protein